MKITVYHFRWEGSTNKNQHLEGGHSSSLNSSRTTLRYSIHFVKCACRIKSCYSHQQPNWPYSKISPLLPPPLISTFLLSGITSQISYMHPSYCHRMCIGENANKFFFMFVLLDISLIYSMQSIYLLTRQILTENLLCTDWHHSKWASLWHPQSTDANSTITHGFMRGINSGMANGTICFQRNGVWRVWVRRRAERVLQMWNHKCKCCACPVAASCLPCYRIRNANMTGMSGQERKNTDNKEVR